MRGECVAAQFIAPYVIRALADFELVADGEEEEENENGGDEGLGDEGKGGQVGAIHSFEYGFHMAIASEARNDEAMAQR